MKKALITGVLGQDGTYLARLLLSKGYEVHGLIRSPFQREEERIRRRFPSEEMGLLHFHTAALEDPFSLVRVLEASHPSEIYHLAGLADSRQSFAVPEEAIQSILVGTLRLLEAGRTLGVEARYFLASSCEVFGIPTETPQVETTMMKPITPYGVAKMGASHLARIHRERYNQFVSVGILYNHESPLRPANFLSRRISRVVAQIKSGKSEKLTMGDLTSERDWSDARDFVQGYWLALQAPSAFDTIFASGTRRTVQDLIEIAFGAAGLDYREFVKIEPANADPFQAKTGLCGNASKAEKELGWKRQWTFKETVEDMVRAEMENRPEIERANPVPTRHKRK